MRDIRELFPTDDAAVPFGEATQTVDLGLPGADGSDARSFDVLVAGASLPPNPGELIETDRRSANTMESLLQQAKTRYDLIVVDTPAVDGGLRRVPVAWEGGWCDHRRPCGPQPP